VSSNGDWNAELRAEDGRGVVQRPEEGLEGRNVEVVPVLLYAVD
jgi:hypothetical protein